MERDSQECPVCTLYMRPGISLKQHLDTHPKDKVIEALLKVRDDNRNGAKPSTALEPALALQEAPQVTTAVTYQQILTTNSSGAIVPQFLQVPTLINGPYVASQSMGFAPTLFNPMYNPYVPQPYPFNNAPFQMCEPARLSPVVAKDFDPDNNVDASSEMDICEQSPGISSSPSTPTPTPPPPVTPPSVIIARSCRSRSVSRSSSKHASPPPPLQMSSPHLVPADLEVSVLSSEPPSPASSPIICKTEESVIVELSTFPADNQIQRTFKCEFVQEVHVTVPDSTDDPRVNNSYDNQIENLNKHGDNLCVIPNDEQQHQKLIDDDCPDGDDECCDELFDDPTPIKYPNNPCPNLPFEHEVIADLPCLPRIAYESKEELIIHHVDSKSSDNLLSKLNGASDWNAIDNTKKLSEDDLGFDYVDEAANFSAPGGSKPVYADLMPASPRMLHDRLLHDLLPPTVSSNAFMELDGLRIFFNNGAPIASASRVSSPPSVIQMADSTKKESPILLNITADESMPARGELSEQESLGADSAWGMFQPGQVKMDPTWTPIKQLKCSSCSLTFTCPKQRRAHKLEAHTKPGKNFKCVTCGEVFRNLRSRREHMAVHADVKPLKAESETPGTAAAAQDMPLTSTVRHCSVCAMSLPSVKELRVHLRQVHGEVKFKCSECEEGFDEELEYSSHLKIHPLKCPDCGKCFYRRANLSLHMKRHMAVKPFECSLCPKTFITRQKLEEHTNGHAGVRPLKCQLCDKTFSRHSNLIQHKNMHHSGKKKQSRDFVCRCGEVFHSQRKLEWHRETHENKPKSCPFCAQKFIHMASVTRHVRRSHMPGFLPNAKRTDDENVSCPVCDRVYLRSSLSVHMRVHSGDRPFQCNVCSKHFTTKWNMELHQWTHQSRSSMPYKCTLCKSAFFREADHIAHLNAHKNLKPFICNICGQKFIRKYNCLRHQEEHQRAKRFTCTVTGCNRSFHRSYYLKDHMKVHTGARPHTCHICGKASSTKSNHNKHVRIHDTREMINTEN